MDEVTKLIQRVQRFIASDELTKVALAKMAGIRDTTLIGSLEKDWSPNTKTLSALIRAIDKYESDRAKKKARDELKAQGRAA
jgi:predicted transcriptional regulator